MISNSRTTEREFVGLVSGSLPSISAAKRETSAA